MKRIIFNLQLSIISICLLGGCSSPTSTPTSTPASSSPEKATETVAEKHRLVFNKKGKFKIVQFTDTHMVHGAPNVPETVGIMKAVLAAEKPDLVILTGDIIIRLPIRESWTELAKIFEEAKIPFTVTLGNHEAEPGTKITRSEIYDILLRSPYFLGEKGPEEIHGVGNFALRVYGQNNRTAALLYCFDSNAHGEHPKYGGYDEPVYFDQVAWYNRKSDEFIAENGGKPLPALAFFHVPVPEFFQIIGKKNTIGYQDEEPCPPKYNTGLFASFLDKEDVMGVFVGHEHGNDYIGMLHRIVLAYGRVTGSGGTKNAAGGWDGFDSGARVIELYENERMFDTWIRTLKGVELTFHYPTTISSVDEETLTYLPAKKVNPTERGVSYKYYEGKFGSVKKIDPAKKVSEGVMKTISIAEAPSEDYFAYEFRCLMQIPERGVYSFYTRSDDDSQIYIDDVLVVDKDWSNISRFDGKVALEAGFHEVKVLFYDDTWGQFLEVGYASKKIRDRKLTDETLYVAESPLGGCISPAQESTPSSPVTEKHRLTFNKKGKFKIVQFTDTHIVHGAPNVSETVGIMKAILAAEKPDLVILTGDIIIRLPVREPWTELAKIFEEAKIPFTITLGNHEAEPGTEITRSEIFDILLRSPYFVGEKGPEEIHGVGNFVLRVYGQDDRTAALLYCFDSNAHADHPKYGGHDEPIYFDQVAWYNRKSDEFTAENGGKPLPALAFFHVPVPEFFQIIGKANTIGHQDEEPCPPKYNTGLFASFLDKEDVKGVFVGHEHGNDYIGMLHHIVLAYGRVTGSGGTKIAAGGWDGFESGARVIELYENECMFDTWIRTLKGIEQTFHYPTTISSVDEETLTYLPAKQVNPTERGVSYKYYEGKFGSVKKIDPTKKVSEGVMKTISIAEAPSEDYFAYEFRCLIQIPERDVYSFYTLSDDDSQIYIDDVLVVDKSWSDLSRFDGKVALEAGFHEVKILYYDDTWGQFLEVGYTSRKIRDRKLSEETLYVTGK